MYTSITQIRVRYSETDRMGYVYYGNYAEYLEVARVESLRSLNISYKEMEDKGILLPVLDYNIRFFKPAFYDDVITVKTLIPSLPSAKILFQYEIFNTANELISKAETTLVFVNKSSGKPCQPLPEIISALQKYFN